MNTTLKYIPGELFSNASFKSSNQADKSNIQPPNISIFSVEILFISLSSNFQPKKKGYSKRLGFACKVVWALS